jgi:hypothetical protein
MVTSVPFQLASSSSRDLERYDEGLSRRPPRGPRSTTHIGAPFPAPGALADKEGQPAGAKAPAKKATKRRVTIR